jgi:hypothetical protein
MATNDSIEIRNARHCTDAIDNQPGETSGFIITKGEIMWVKLDCKFPMNKAVRRLSSDAFRWYIYALCYSGEHLTDGRLDSMDVETITSCMRVPEAVFGEVLASDLVRETDAWQYEIVGYTDTQTSRDYVEKRRADDRTRKASLVSRRNNSAAESAVESVVESAEDSTRIELRIKKKKIDTDKDICIRDLNTNTSIAVATETLTPKLCVSMFVDLWTQKYGHAPTGSLAALGGHFKRVIGKTPDETIKSSISAFFGLSDTWVLKNAHKSTVLVSMWDSLVTGSATTQHVKRTTNQDIALQFRDNILEQMK